MPSVIRRECRLPKRISVNLSRLCENRIPESPVDLVSYEFICFEQFLGSQVSVEPDGTITSHSVLEQADEA
jgi:hypothetical protein